MRSISLIISWLIQRRGQLSNPKKSKCVFVRKSLNNMAHK